MICSSGLKILLIRTADNHHNYTMRAQKEQAKSTDKQANVLHLELLRGIWFAGKLLRKGNAFVYLL